MNIKREPALLAIAIIAPAVQLAVAFLVNDAGLQGLVNAAAAALAGVLVAFVVRGDKLVPAIVGFAQAMLAIALYLGWAPDAELQAGLMSFVAVLAAAWVRSQVDAPVPAEVES